MTTTEKSQGNLSKFRSKKKKNEALWKSIIFKKSIIAEKLSAAYILTWQFKFVNKKNILNSST